MRRLLVLVAAAAILLLSSPALLADPITTPSGAASPGGPEISLLNVSAAGTLYVGRGADEIGSSRWTGNVNQFAPGSTLQSLLAARGVTEVMMFRSSFALSQGLSSLSAQDRQTALTYTGAGRLPFQQLLLLPGNAQVTVAQSRTGARTIPVVANPEPASLLLLGTGIAALGFGRRRRQVKD